MEEVVLSGKSVDYFSIRPIRISDSTLKLDEDASARMRIQQLINILMAVDTEFRVRGLRDPSHVAFMAQFSSTDSKQDSLAKNLHFSFEARGSSIP